MSENEALRIVGDVEIGKLHLKPGDVLVVRTESRIPMQVSERIRDLVQPKLPSGVQCLVIDPGIDLSVLTRAEIDAKAA
jgi:hypothetical protein